MHRERAALHAQRDENEDQHHFADQVGLHGAAESSHVEHAVTPVDERQPDQHQLGRQLRHQHVLVGSLDRLGTVAPKRDQTEGRHRADLEEHEKVEQVAGQDHAHRAGRQQQKQRAVKLEPGEFLHEFQAVDRARQLRPRRRAGRQRVERVDFENDAHGDGKSRRQRDVPRRRPHHVDLRAMDEHATQQREDDQRHQRGDARHPTVARLGAHRGEERRRKSGQQGQGQRQRRKMVHQPHPLSLLISRTSSVP